MKQGFYAHALIFLSLFMFCSSFTADASAERSRNGKAVSAKNNAGMEWTGHISGQKERLVKVITDREEWDALWKRAFDLKSPDIDFENYVAACVFLGHEADWLYSIGYGKPYVKGNSKVIPYSLHEIVLELMGPFKASGQYHIKVYKKEGGLEFLLEESPASVRRTRGI